VQRGMTRQPTTGALRGTSPTVHQTTHHQIPAVSPPLAGSGDSPQAGRPAAEHGGAGEPNPRPCRAPFNDLPRRQVTVVIAGSA
jgi:hypothetical protein